SAEPQQDRHPRREPRPRLRQRQAGGAGRGHHAHLAPAFLGSDTERAGDQGAVEITVRHDESDGQRASPPQPASSRDRAVAAAIALLSVSGRALASIRIFSAAAVVPPGLVTATRSAAASSGLAANRAPEPDTVWRASIRARSGGIPCSTAAFSINSASRNT